VAFENLGPPRLSKLLFEADLLRTSFRTMDAVRVATPQELSEQTFQELRGNAARRSEIVSIGIPILLPDGSLLRGPECKIPHALHPDDAFVPTPAAIDEWAGNGWVDLRVSNMGRWKSRFARIEAEISSIPDVDSSSRFLRDRHFWGTEGLIQPGKVVGWVLAVEEQGARMK
jgi:hypothetical protein